MHAPHRERRPWTPQEDEMLRAAVNIEEPGNPNPSKWFAIAQRVPGRTNKDCRKRWFAKMTSNIVKGIWSPEEDQKLLEAIEKHGTRWSIVASCVHTRNSDQCAKRWTDTLDPSIVRTIWTPEDDRVLIDAVSDHGTAWTKIVRLYFPGRTGLSAKNRYASLMRSHQLQRNRPPSNSRSSASSTPPGPLRRPSSGAAVGRASSSYKQSSVSDLPLDLIPFPHSSNSSQHNGVGYAAVDTSDEELFALLSPPTTRHFNSASDHPPQGFAGSLTARMPSTNKTAAYNYTNGYQPQPNALISADHHFPQHYSSNQYYDVTSFSTPPLQMELNDGSRIKHEAVADEIHAGVLRHADDYWCQWR